MLYKSKTIELLELLDIVGFIVGMFLWVLFVGPSSITHVIGYIGLLGTGFMQALYWVEFPVERRLYPIF